MSGLRITISGNIGCGKTSVLTNLKLQFPALSIQTEPVNEWEAWLSKFYSNPKQHALGLQVKILSTYRQMNATHTHHPVIYERSPLDSVEVFANILTRNQVLTNMEFDLLTELFEFCGWTPDVYIYLKADPTTCMTRIRSRNRSSETTVSEDYISELHDEYNRYFQKLDDSSTVSTYVIDANESKKNVLDHVIRIIQEILVEKCC
jgi:deoxyadenosine/deoxycytidine kinase